jgi:hypothetical protein
MNLSRKKKSSAIAELYRLATAQAANPTRPCPAQKTGAPHDIRQAGILNLGFKAVAFRAHQALPVRDAHNSATLGSNQNN